MYLLLCLGYLETHAHFLCGYGRYDRPHTTLLLKYPCKPFAKEDLGLLQHPDLGLLQHTLSRVVNLILI